MADQRFLLTLSLRLLIVWFVLSVVFLFIGEPLINLLMPYLTFVFNHISNQYSGNLTIINEQDSVMIQASTIINHAIYISNIPVSPPGVKLKSSIHLMHSLVPIVILYTAICSWPTKKAKRRIILYLASLPSVLITLGLTIPFLLAGQIEVSLFKAAEQFSGRSLEYSPIINWMFFIETGGIWLIPLMLALTCVMGTQRYIRQ